VIRRYFRTFGVTPAAMRSYPEKLVLVATFIATPLFMPASESARPENLPVSIHELNFSPSFSGHPVDQTLLAKPPAAQKNLPAFTPVPSGTLRGPSNSADPTASLALQSAGTISATRSSSGPTATASNDRELIQAARELADAKAKLDAAEARLEKLLAERKALESR
jgi:hypothetical protein